MDKQVNIPDKLLWTAEEASANVKFLALAIMIGGAMAGGDGK